LGVSSTCGGGACPLAEDRQPDTNGTTQQAGPTDSASGVCLIEASEPDGKV
jgi:hypothetical protein